MPDLAKYFCQKKNKNPKPTAPGIQHETTTSTTASTATTIKATTIKANEIKGILGIAEHLAALAVGRVETVGRAAVGSLAAPTADAGRHQDLARPARVRRTHRLFQAHPPLQRPVQSSRSSPVNHRPSHHRHHRHHRHRPSLFCSRYTRPPPPSSIFSLFFFLKVPLVRRYYDAVKLTVGPQETGRTASSGFSKCPKVLPGIPSPQNKAKKKKEK